MNANLQMLRRSPSAEQLKLQNLRLRVGDHAIDVGALRVIGHGESSRLTAKAVAVLLELVRHAGNTVGRDELLETVWKDRVTTPDVLTQAIKELRRAFGDSDKPSQYIETIPKVGYRLLADVSVIEADEIPFGKFEHMSLRAENETWVDTQADDLPAAVESAGGAETAPAQVPPVSTTSTIWWRLMLPLVALVVVALVAYFVKVGSDSSPPSWRATNVRALTSDPDAELLPHISPDGTRVAFGKLVEATGLDRLFIRTVEPSQLVPLAPNTETAHDIRPVWSPDGSRIAYERITRTSCTLYIVASLGGHEREIGDCQDFSTGYFDFTPDGKELIISLRSDGPNSDLGLVRSNIATGAKEPLRYDRALGDEDLEPRYSPDGHWIAFRRGLAPYSDLFVMRADGGGVRQLTHLAAYIRGYTWTADNAALVFSSDYRGKFELYAVGVEGGALQSLQVTPAIFPDAARGDKTVVYQIQRATSELAEIDLDASAATHNFAASTGNDFSPSVSPDRNHVAFVSDRSGSSQLWLYDRATDSAEPLTDYRDAALSGPVWRADSAALLLTVRQEPVSSRLVEIDLASRRARDVSGKGENVLFGTYGAKPDSVLLAIGASSREARLVQRLHPGQSEQADETLASGVQHAEADAARGLIYYTRIGAGGLFRRTVATGEEQPLTDKVNSLMIDGWRIVDGKVWSLVPVDVHKTILREFDPDKNAARVVAELPIDLNGRHFSVSADGKRLYLARVPRQDSDIGAFELERTPAH